jgi:plasmid maintenance system antidote protein VapI
MQGQFIQYLKEKHSNNNSFADEVASALDIGYDAAYRRINQKTNLTLEEGVKLAKHFKVSLNKLYEVGSENTILVEKSPIISNEEKLESYFTQSIENLTPLTKLKSASILYSAKDIPLFYTLKDSVISRYKIYVWLKLTNKEMTKNKISFDKFIETIPHSLLEKAYELGRTYNYINITEFWNDNTINGTIQQIIYFHESQLLSKELALKICDDLEEIIHHVERQTINQSIINSKNNASYNLYKSDLLTMSNIIMVKTSFKKAFFIPYTVLEYLKVEHQETCDTMEDFFKRQMINSKLLAHSGEKDRTLFFNRMHQKINILRERIDIEKKSSFL